MQTPGHRSRSSFHLYMALTDAVSLAGYPDDGVLLVNISTDRQDARTDTACILNRGDHASITHRSYVYYRYAMVRSAAVIRAEEARGRITPVAPLAPDILDRVCAGLEASPNTPEETKLFYREAERLRLNP